jgi:hypothetical protein
LSYDEADALRDFGEAQGITYDLLSDPDSEVIRSFGILNSLIDPNDHPWYGILYPGNYVINADGASTHTLDTMVDFYCRHPGLQVTDRGRLSALPEQPEICLLSANPTEHHQVALAEGRGDEKGMLDQVSFHVGSLEDLRELDAELGKAGVEHWRAASAKRLEVAS